MPLMTCICALSLTPHAPHVRLLTPLPDRYLGSFASLYQHPPGGRRTKAEEDCFRRWSLP